MLPLNLAKISEKYTRHVIPPSVEIQRLSPPNRRSARRHGYSRSREHRGYLHWMQEAAEPRRIAKALDAVRQKIRHNKDLRLAPRVGPGLLNNGWELLSGFLKIKGTLFNYFNKLVYLDRLADVIIHSRRQTLLTIALHSIGCHGNDPGL